MPGSIFDAFEILYYLSFFFLNIFHLYLCTVIFLNALGLMDNASRFTLFSKKLSALIGIMFTYAHKRVCWLKSLPIFFHVFPLLFQFLSIMATVCEAKRGDCALQWCRAHWQHVNIHTQVLSLHAFSSSAAGA